MTLHVGNSKSKLNSNFGSAIAKIPTIALGQILQTIQGAPMQQENKNVHAKYQLFNWLSCSRATNNNAFHAKRKPYKQVSYSLPAE